MINNIQDLFEIRNNWVKANKENGFEDGLKKLLTELYPDNAHFIFELLQNAEDAKATKVSFKLFDNKLEFEHNGRKKFNLSDIESITSIGSSTKIDDQTNIGKFGVGFKAVYAYTLTPEIVSEDYHFEIQDMVVPFELSEATISDKTLFIFPFNNPKKRPEQANKEIERNLIKFQDNVILFLTNIQRIEFILANKEWGYIERSDLDNKNIIKIDVIHPGEDKINSSYFLRFDKSVKVTDETRDEVNCSVSIAFGLELNESDKHNKWKVIPLNPGQVSIYFPAEKETSKLFFHINAPFASTVARDSIRECESNNVLRDHLANLLCESLEKIRDKGLLNLNFLGVLPNNKDNLSEFYQPFLDRLITEFQEKDLTPMKEGGFASANGIFRGKKALSDLISDADLAEILGEDFYPPMWVVNAQQRNQREDNFLSELNIHEWSEKDLIKYLLDNKDKTLNWLSIKIDEWFQDLYILLGDYYNSDDNKYEYNKNSLRSNLSKLKIIKLVDGSLSTSEFCYFNNINSRLSNDLNIVSEKVYSSGKSEIKQKKAKEFLEIIGVKNYGDKEQIELILKTKYSGEAIKNETNIQDVSDIILFITFLENNESSASLFSNYYMLKAENGTWHKPNELYYDSPYKETLLSYFIKDKREYSFIDRLKLITLGIPTDNDEEISIDEYSFYDLKIISNDYLQIYNNNKLIWFFDKVNVNNQLQVKKVSCIENPNWEVLNSKGSKGNEVDHDYTISKLNIVIKYPNHNLSLLMWNTMNNLDEKYLIASYKKSDKLGFRYAPSQLVHILRDSEWIPQGDLFVKPSDAVIDLLPEDFIIRKELKWLKDVNFGKNTEQIETVIKEKNKILEEIALQHGYDTFEEMEEVVSFAKQHPDEFNKLKNSIKEKADRSSFGSSDTEKRKEKIQSKYSELDNVTTERKERSELLLSEADIYKVSYLKNLYTDDDHDLICQICDKIMPFKKKDGEYYFEAVNLVPNKWLKKQHHSKFIALCPVCSAKYREFVKTDDQALKELHQSILQGENHNIPINFGSEKCTISFRNDHLTDLIAYFEMENIDFREKP